LQDYHEAGQTDNDDDDDVNDTARVESSPRGTTSTISIVNGFDSVEAAASTTTPTTKVTEPALIPTATSTATIPHANGVVAAVHAPPVPNTNGAVVNGGGGGGTTTPSTTTAAPLESTTAAASTAAAVLSLSNVTLQYQAMDHPALSDVNVDFYPGDRVAIVGRSGSGKSSLLRTLLRFYDPTVGRVSYRGIDLTELSRRQLSSVLTMVPQEPALFPLTLLDNVLYGIEKDDAIHDTYGPEWQDRARIALEHAGLDLAEIPLDTRIGDGGRALSGGQKQRVAIARALVRQDAADSAAETILILDEPTAALDSATEQQVIATLRDLMDRQKDLCVIMVTHRLNIIQALGVNRVLVMDQGRIVESGRPADLLADAKGIYSRLAVEQGIVGAGKQEHQQEQQEQRQQQQPQTSTLETAVSASSAN
jgi:ABC-type multidrug transport system fused ATPase/permease subunit